MHAEDDVVNFIRDSNGTALGTGALHAQWDAAAPKDCYPPPYMSQTAIHTVLPTAPPPTCQPIAAGNKVWSYYY